PGFAENILGQPHTQTTGKFPRYHLRRLFVKPKGPTAEGDVPGNGLNLRPIGECEVEFRQCLQYQGAYGARIGALDSICSWRKNPPLAFANPTNRSQRHSVSSRD